MKEKYYELLKQYGIADTLILLSELSYTRKFNLIEFLIKSYTPITINKALNDYQIKYININRVELRMMKGILIGFCKKYEE